MSIPDSVTQLAQARMDARAAKDFKLADKYREDLMHAGYEVVDVAGGYELKPKKPYITLAYPRDIRPIDLENDVTVGIIVDGFTKGVDNKDLLIIPYEGSKVSSSLILIPSK